MALIDLVAAFQPRAIMLEEVPGFAEHALPILQDSLKALDYTVETTIKQLQVLTGQEKNYCTGTTKKHKQNWKAARATAAVP